MAQKKQTRMLTKSTRKVVKVNNLSLTQIRFAFIYIQCGNATKAAVTAGYSRKTAHQIGYRLLRNVEISKFIGLSTQRIIEKAEISRAQVMARVMQICDQAIARDHMTLALACLEFLAEATGAIPLSHKHKFSNPVANFGSLSLEELTEILVRMEEKAPTKADAKNKHLKADKTGHESRRKVTQKMGATAKKPVLKIVANPNKSRKAA